MAKSQAIEQEKKIHENKPVSPHLAWETPQHNPNEEAKQKGQLGQNARRKARGDTEGH